MIAQYLLIQMSQCHYFVVLKVMSTVLPTTIRKYVKLDPKFIVKQARAYLWLYSMCLVALDLRPSYCDG